MKKTIEAIQKKAQELENRVTDARGVIIDANRIILTAKGTEITDADDYALPLSVQNMKELLEATDEEETIYYTKAWEDEVAPTLQRAIGNVFESTFGKTWDSEDATEWYEEPDGAFEIVIKTDYDGGKEIRATAKIGDYLYFADKRQELIQVIEALEEYDRCEDYGYAGLGQTARIAVEDAYITEAEGWRDRILQITENLDSIKTEMDYQLENTINALTIDEDEEMEADILASIEGTKPTADSLLQDAKEEMKKIQKAKESISWCFQTKRLMCGSNTANPFKIKERDMEYALMEKQNKAYDLLRSIQEIHTAIQEVLTTIQTA